MTEYAQPKSINSLHMNADEEEQYSFGPWLIEITEEKLMPPQYVAYKEKIMTSDFSVKVPVNKDRKDVRPGMLLYRQVLIFGEKDVTILTASGSKIKEVSVLLKDIKYVIRGGELLNNYIEFGTQEENYCIEYYTVAETITSKILGHIRNEFTKNSMPKKNLVNHINSAEDNPLFKYFMIKEKGNAEIKAIAHQKEKHIIKQSEKLIQKAINQLNKVKMNEVLFMTNGTELIMASGDIKNSTGASVNYSYQHLYIDLKGLDEVRTYTDEAYMDCQLLTFIIGDSRQSVRVYDDFNSNDLKALL